MKTFVFVVFMIFTYSYVSGQKSYRQEQLGKDTVNFHFKKNQRGISRDQYGIPEIKSYRRQDQLRTDRDFRKYDSLVAEQYPGANRYYGRKSYLQEFTYKKSFIVDPGSDGRQFLIIKDPIRNTLRK
jgi:hypothetical protein